MTKTTAWFGAKHPAEAIACPTCDAGAGKPCVSRSFGAGVLGSIAGMHAERVLAARDQTVAKAS